MYSKILAANDGSPGGLKALDAAIELARQVSAELHMVTVEELPRFPASIDEVAEEKDEANHRFAPVIAAATARASAAGLKIETHLAPGHVAEAIVGLVKDRGSTCSGWALWAIRSSMSGSSAEPPTASSAWRLARCWS